MQLGQHMGHQCAGNQRDEITVRKTGGHCSYCDDNKKVKFGSSGVTHQQDDGNPFKQKNHSQDWQRKNLNDILKSTAKNKSQQEIYRTVNNYRTAGTGAESIVTCQTTRSVACGDAAKKWIDQIHHRICKADLAQSRCAVRKEIPGC